MNSTLIEIWEEQAFHASCAEHNERSILADCARMMGLDGLAKKVINPAAPRDIINKGLNIIQRKAKVTERHDVLEILSFAGLVYG